MPLLYISGHLKHLALRVEMFGKTTAIQLAYLLEAAPFLEDLHLDVSSHVFIMLYSYIY